MPEPRKRSRSPRAQLSRERVLQAAITLTDEHGLEALTMRKLGQALSVEAMAIYHYFANRDEVLGAMADTIVGEIAVPAPGADWKKAMRQRARSARDVLLRHPWASGLVESRTSLSPTRLRYAEVILGTLRDAGFSTVRAYRAFLTLDSYIYGFSLQETSWDLDPATLPAAAAALRTQIPTDTHPNLAAVMAHVLAAPAKPTSSGDATGLSAEFSFGLELILDGLDKLRRRPARS